MTDMMSLLWAVYCWVAATSRRAVCIRGTCCLRGRGGAIRWTMQASVPRWVTLPSPSHSPVASRWLTCMCALSCVLPGACGDFVYGPDGVLRGPRHAAGSHMPHASAHPADARMLQLFSALVFIHGISSTSWLLVLHGGPRSRTCWVWRVHGGCRCSSSRGTGTPSWAPWAS